ncbi:MAG TPA: efflux RND transporter permease subunit [Longimicrobiales bacterium]|nr:efflux RND transporter permease subunit [Longimicrobiales bacterium]
MSLPRLAIGRPVAVAMFFIAATFVGIVSLTRLPVDLLPDIAYPRLVVHTGYPQVAPAEVERFITEPLEAAFARVPGRVRTESQTREGVSVITLRFAWGTDMDFAALNVRERIDGLRGQLPEDADRPVVLRTDPRSEPIMALSASGAGDLWTLKELAESVFRRRLEQIDGVAQAAITGGLEREIQVDVDQQRLDSYGLGIDDVARALSSANAASRSGTILRGRYRYALRTLGELQSVQEIGDIVIAQAGSGGAAGRDGGVLVRDVATVTDGFRERESIARYNGEEAIGLLIFKEGGANTVRVAERVEAVLDQLRADYPAVTIQVATSQATFVAGAIDNLIVQMLLGGALAFLVLILFLRDPRYPVAIALAIPISIITSFALLHAAGVSINIMTLGGLALGCGMLVDNSIVVIENIVRHREKGLRAAAAAVVGTTEVQRAITAATLTTIAVFGPVIYVEGVAGELFGALAFAVAFSLLASLAVAVMLLPMLAARWDGPPRARSAFLAGFDRAWDRVAATYENSLDLALANRGRVVAVALLLLVVTLPLALGLERSVLPDVDQNEFRARVELPPGTPIEATAALAAGLERRFMDDPAVDAVFSRIGRQVAVGGLSDDASGIHTAVLDVKLRAGATARPVLARLRPALADLPAGVLSLETGQSTALGQLMGATEADLAVRIRGDDLDRALVYAAELERSLAGRPRLTNVRVGTELGQPEYLLEIDRDRAAAYGLDANRVAQFVESAMRGRAATQYVAFDRKIDVVVRLPERERRNLATLETLSIDGAPLRELVRIHETVGPVEIRRIDQSRVVPVYADITGGGIDRAVASVQGVVDATPPPDGLRVEVGGENEEMRRSFRDLAFAFALALLLVYMILAAQFESFVHPFTVLLSVPLGLVGAVIALWLLGGGLNTVSLIGMVILIGIVDNDAVVKIDFINQMRREGMTTRDAIRAAGHARLRPIVMNSITTMLAVTPMMLGIGPGAGLQAPLAIAVFGGLFTSTVLTLIVVPVAYELIDDARTRVAARAHRRAAAPAPAAGD